MPTLPRYELDQLETIQFVQENMVYGLKWKAKTLYVHLDYPKHILSSEELPEAAARKIINLIRNNEPTTLAKNFKLILSCRNTYSIQVDLAIENDINDLILDFLNTYHNPLRKLNKNHWEFNYPLNRFEFHDPAQRDKQEHLIDFFYNNFSQTRELAGYSAELIEKFKTSLQTISQLEPEPHTDACPDVIVALPKEADIITDFYRLIRNQTREQNKINQKINHDFTQKISEQILQGHLIKDVANYTGRFFTLHDASRFAQLNKTSATAFKAVLEDAYGDKRFKK